MRRERPTYRLWADTRLFTKSRRNLVALQGAVEWKKQNASLSNSPIDSFWSNEYVYPLHRISLARTRTFLVGWCLFFVDNITDLHTTAYHLFGGDHRADTRSVSLSRTKTKRKIVEKSIKFYCYFYYWIRASGHYYYYWHFRSDLVSMSISFSFTIHSVALSMLTQMLCLVFVFFYSNSMVSSFRTKWTVRWRLWIAFDEELCIFSYSTSSSSSNSQWHMQCRIVRRNSIRFYSN